MARKPTEVKEEPQIEYISLQMTEDGCCKPAVIAKLFNLSVRRIQQLTQEGVLPATANGRKYELAPTIQHYVKYLSDKAYGRKSSEAEAELKKEKLKAEIELKNLQSEYRQLQNDIVSGKYVEVTAVKSDYRRFFITLKKFVLSIPSKITSSLGGVIDDPAKARAIEAELNHDVIALLNGFVVAGEKEAVGGVEIGKKAVAKNKKV